MPLPWKPVGEAWIPAAGVEPILEDLFWFVGEMTPSIGDLLLPEPDDPVRGEMVLFPDDVRKGALVGLLSLVREPLLMKVDPGRSPNLGKAN